MSVSSIEKDIASCLYKILRDNAFIGGLLQELNFKFDNTSVPTAAIYFNPKTSKFELLINTDFFQSKTADEKVAILTHEILHFLHNHLMRFGEMDVPMEDRKYWNIAADMSINQFIPNLPEGCIKVEDFKTADGKVFPKYKSMDVYHDLIDKNREKDKTKGKDLAKPDGTPEKDSHGNDMVDENGKPFQNEDGTPKQGTGNEGSNKNQLDKYKEFDEHDWDALPEEDKERMLREMKNVLNRTIEKTSYSSTSIPGNVQDILKEIETHLQKFNYKAILKAAIKKTAMAQDREHSWKRKNKRYQNYAPGTTNSKIPKLNMYVDTSGSISYRELNEFLDVIDGFLKQGTKTCSLALWHTDMYYKKKYKVNSRLQQAEVQGGGTDPDPVLEDILKTKPELSIILTDGYFDMTDVNLKTKDIIWIISEGGNINHPNRHLGKTIPMKGIK